MEHTGANFTTTLHDEPKGPTLPTNNKRRSSSSSSSEEEQFNVIITGAGKGIGRAISISYAQAGATGLCISSRTQSDLDSLSIELTQINPKLKLVQQICDTTSSESIASLAKTCQDVFNGQIDVVIANAGIISKYLDDTDNEGTEKQGEDVTRRLPRDVIEDDDFVRVTTVNYLGTYYTAKHFVPLLLTSKGRCSARAFIVITSLAAHVTESAFVPGAYNISKIAVTRLVEHLANDHRDGASEEAAGDDANGKGLLAYAVHPGEVVTPQTERHSTRKGDRWEQVLQTSPELVGGFLTWLTYTRRNWLSGRYLSVHWDVDELEAKKDEIVKKDLLKFRMVF